LKNSSDNISDNNILKKEIFLNNNSNNKPDQEEKLDDVSDDNCCNKDELNNNSINNFNQEEKKIFYKFLKIIGREIEVKFKETEGKYYKKIYFFKAPKYFWIDKLRKAKFLEKTPRTSLDSKLDYLNKKLDKFLLNINVSYVSRPYSSSILRKYYRDINLINFDLINFTFILVINILLLIYFYENPSYSIAEDLNSQQFLYIQSSRVGIRYHYIYYISIIFSVCQFALISFWFYFRYNVTLTLSSYKKFPSRKY